MELSREILTNAVDALDNHHLEKSIPRISKQQMLITLSKIKDVFATEKSLLELNGDFVIIGDIHGHLLDLARVLRKFGAPPKTNYVFLGDIVDRGEWCIECLYVIYDLKVNFPNNVFILRGNHEFDNPTMDFHHDQEKYFISNDLYSKFIEVFTYTPVSAVINKEYICLHGGIGPNVIDTDTIANIDHPITAYSEVLDEIVWSDPIDEKIRFEESSRGCGFFFGEIPVKDFLLRNNLRAIIRGHVSIPEGVEKLFGGLIYTVHTASCMSPFDENKSGALVLRKGQEPESHIFDSIKASEYTMPKHQEKVTIMPKPIPQFKAFRRPSKAKLNIKLG